MSLTSAIKVDCRNIYLQIVGLTKEDDVFFMIGSDALLKQSIHLSETRDIQLEIKTPFLMFPPEHDKQFIMYYNPECHSQRFVAIVYPRCESTRQYIEHIAPAVVFDELRGGRLDVLDDHETAFFQPLSKSRVDETMIFDAIVFQYAMYAIMEPEVALQRTRKLPQQERDAFASRVRNTFAAVKLWWQAEKKQYNIP